MTDRVQRLKKLLTLQEQLKALHELRHAGFVAEAVAAKNEAAEIVDRFNAEDLHVGACSPKSTIAASARRCRAKRRTGSSPTGEAAKVATATARTNMVERNYREARAASERERGDRSGWRSSASASKPSAGKACHKLTGS